MGDNVFLMGTHGDLRIHAGKGQVAAVILPGADRIKTLVIQGDKCIPAFRIFEDPVFKCLFDGILLLLSEDGFLLIEDSPFISVCVKSCIVDFCAALI